MTDTEDNNRNGTRRQRFECGLPENATDEEKTDFVMYILRHWQRRNIKNQSLQSEYWDYFESFTLADFQALPAVTRNDLRTHLRDNGVFVTRKRGYPVARALYEALVDDLQWPKDDPERPPLTPAQLQRLQLSNYGYPAIPATPAPARLPGSVTTSALHRPFVGGLGGSSPVTSIPSIHTISQPASHTGSQPMFHSAPRHVATPAPQPVAAPTPQPVAAPPPQPVAAPPPQPVPATAQQPMSPAASQPMPPVAPQLMAPAASQPMPPVASQAMPPMAPQSMPPAVPQPIPPKALQPMPPKAPQPMSPPAQQPMPPKAPRLVMDPELGIFTRPRWALRSLSFENIEIDRKAHLLWLAWRTRLVRSPFPRESRRSAVQPLSRSSRKIPVGTMELIPSWNLTMISMTRLNLTMMTRWFI